MALAGVFTSFLSPVLIKFASVRVATMFATVWLRTAGYLQRVTGFTAGPLPFTESTPATRLLGGPIVFPFGFIPGTASFLEGFAYKDSEDLADGWLSFVGEVVFAPVPGIETGTEKALKALKRGDVATFSGEMAETLQEVTGLADLAAFFRGVEQIGKDFQALGLPTLHPAPWFWAGAIGTVSWLDKLFTDLGGQLEGLITPPPTPPPVIPEHVVHREHGHPLGHPADLPTTPEAVREFFRATRRVIQRVPDLWRIIQELKKG